MDRSLESLTHFHPLIAGWFTDRIGHPTDVQQQAWPRIATGEHVLITAPTGTGKTLAAFLYALNQLITGAWPTGHTSVLYVSPLKALNYDIQRNLLGPLEELKKVFEGEGEAFPELRVSTRTGDTPQAERRRMLRHPPEVLITTPESVNLLLSSPSAKAILTRLSTVILDEIHAVVGNKRGVHLITAVERLVRLSGEFQRIALSATLRPLEMMAEFVGGFSLQGTPENPRYEPRRVITVRSALQKQYDLRLRYIPVISEEEEPADVWGAMVAGVKNIILQNRSTLIFVNSRRLCETLTLKINQGEKEPVAYSHHGSLSLEVRSEVERRLKAGELKAIVATHSLELGIDIGAIDEVVLIQSPFSISSAVQRVGRAGHQVGEISRGTFFPTHPRDFLEAAVLVPAILHSEIEEVKPILCPLDVLSQVIVSMVGVEAWKTDSLFAALKTSYPYRHLSRGQFDLVLNMLSGRYAHTLIRELKPRVSIDRLDGTVSSRKGALQALYSSGGVIPDRGYFQLRHLETKARIGELDEEFVWEASVGDTFSMGAQSWQVRQITHNDVLVSPAKSRGDSAPFWKGEESGRDFHFSERIGRFLEEADGRLNDPGFPASLQQERRMDEAAAGHLVDFLKRQKEETGCRLPHRHHLVVESISRGPGGAPGNMAVIHTLWGGRVNRPLAMALDAAWEMKFGHRLEFFVGNDSVAILLPQEVHPEELVSLVDAHRIDDLLRKRLEGSGFFGARFRECAGRALLIERTRWGERMPLWMSRLHSQKLLEAVLHFEDFPILLETWRTCLQDEFDLENLKKLLNELASGVIAWTAVRTAHPSPFAGSDWWRQVSKYMYMDDRPLSDRVSRLRESFLREIILQPGLRPTVSPELVKQFEAKRQRLSPGYSPASGRELIDWLKERLLIPRGEWEELIRGMQRDHGLDRDSLMEELKGKLIRIQQPEAGETLVAAREMVDLILDHGYDRRKEVRAESWEGLPFFRERSAKEDEEGENLSWFLGQWLSFYGPRNADFIGSTLGIGKDRLPAALEDLLDARKLVQGELVSGGGAEDICDSENFEILVRLARAEAQPAFEPVKIDRLPLFVADFQGITKPRGNLEGLRERIEQLLCYPAEAGIWESEVFPARLQPYDPSWLDTLMQEGDLQWVGNEGHRVAFCFEPDLDLMREDSPEPAADADETTSPLGASGSGDLARLFPDPSGRYSFAVLLTRSSHSPAALAEELWTRVWRGQLTNDTFIAMRRAIMTKFKPPDPGSAKDRRTLGRWRHLRAGLRKKKEGKSLPGNWHLLPSPTLPGDLLEVEERRKDRVRLLLERYGILFREILQRELPTLGWSSIFRSLRIMELSGEVLAGYFFEGIPGPQFISPEAFRRLRRALPEEQVFWLNAADPASLCGIQLESIKGTLPPRVASTHLVYHGDRLVMVSKRYGRDLTFHIPSEDPHLPDYLGPLHHLLSRPVQPLRRIAIETINGEPAAQSPYVPVLRTAFKVIVDYKSVNLSPS
jgi:ATP-dependent helicase Lhr and Lhr-like helicase